MATRTVTSTVDVTGEQYAREVRARATGAWGEYLLEALTPDGKGWHLLAYIQRDTDRPTRLEWTVETTDYREVGMGYPTLADALSRAGKHLIEKGA